MATPVPSQESGVVPTVLPTLAIASGVFAEGSQASRGRSPNSGEPSATEARLRGPVRLLHSAIAVKEEPVDELAAASGLRPASSVASSALALAPCVVRDDAGNELFEFGQSEGKRLRVS